RMHPFWLRIFTGYPHQNEKFKPPRHCVQVPCLGQWFERAVITTFLVVFVGLSPFPVNHLTDTNRSAEVTFPGTHHYQVSVTLSDGATFRITYCPEIEA